MVPNMVVIHGRGPDTLPRVIEVDANGNLYTSIVIPAGTTVGIASYTVPAGAPVVGQVVIAVTGTAVVLSAASVALPAGTVLVSALEANNAAGGTVGGVAVTNIVNGAGNGFILEAGKSTVVNADDLADVYVNGTAGDIFSFAAG